MSADPGSLPDNAVSDANVTLASSTPNVLGTSVRVALWKSSSAGKAITKVNKRKRLAKSY